MTAAAPSGVVTFLFTDVGTRCNGNNSFGGTGLIRRRWRRKGHADAPKLRL
jgi:hypothetical protein